MKKTSVGPLAAVIAMVLLGAMFIYFFVSLNRMDKKIGELQQTTLTDSNKLSQIVNFINSANNAK